MNILQSALLPLALACGFAVFAGGAQAATEAEQCKTDGGTWVVNSRGQGHCFLELEPIKNVLPPLGIALNPVCVILRTFARGVQARRFCAAPGGGGDLP